MEECGLAPPTIIKSDHILESMKDAPIGTDDLRKTRENDGHHDDKTRLIAEIL